jgi:uncharacterized protein (DUF2141 family)
MSNPVRVSPLSALGAVTAALLIFVPASAAPAGPYAELCSANKPAVLARVSGLKEPRGIVSVKLYASNPKTFLEKGAYLRKIEVPVRGSGPIDVCVPVPDSGAYALSVRHEVKGKKSRSDGGGFSGNPSLSMLDVVFQRKPKIEKVSFVVNGKTRVVPVKLNYLQGGSIRPVS